MSLASFGVKRPVAANLMVFGLMGAGIVFGTGLRREFFPETEPSQVVVAAPYPGASPEEVEKSLATKIEDRLIDLKDVKELTTTATEGAATLRLEFKEGIDIEVAVARVKREIDALQDLPERAERIVVDKFEPNIPVIMVSLAAGEGGEGGKGQRDKGTEGQREEEDRGVERELKTAIREMRDDLRSLPGMGDIIVTGVRGDELAVEVRSEAMLEHGLSLPMIADQVKQAMLELPGGSVRSGTANVSVRTMSAEERGAAVKRIVVKAGGEGQVLRLEDVARVEEGFVDADVLTRFNGSRSTSLIVYKTGKEDAVEMAEMVKAYAAGREGKAITMTLRERLKSLVQEPGETKPVSSRLAAYELGLSRRDGGAALPGPITLHSDLSRFISQRLELLTRNALAGGTAVYFTLLLILSWRAAFWVVFGLTASILGTLVAMRIAGITLNLLTMFGLIVVVGMLVDDAIVIAENIISRHARGEPAKQAAIEGTREVQWPVLGTVVTTIFAFVPLMLIQGRIGDLLGALPLVVACALGVSLVEAYLTLPTHMAHSLEVVDKRIASGHEPWLFRLEKRSDAARERWFDRWLLRPYGAALRACLHRPWLTLSATLAAMIVSVGMVAGGRLPFVFFEAADTETLVGSLRMPVGTPLERTNVVVKRIEAAAIAQPEVMSVSTIVGYTGDVEGQSSLVQGHLAQLFIELHPVEKRQAQGQRTSTEVKEAILRETGDLTGIKSLRLEGIAGGPAGPPITLAVTGRDERALVPVVEGIKAALAEYEGVFGIADDADTGLRELRLSLRPGASELGFTAEGVARQVRGAVYGLEAHTFAGDREDVDVRVRLPRDVRRSLAAIEQTHLFTPDGAAVPMAEVVEIEEAEGYATVRRLNRLRAITVTADVDTARANVEDVMAAVWPRVRELEAANPGVKVVERGRQKDLAESFSTLPIGAAVALGLNYIVLAWLFSSYVQPLIIMTSIPFAIIGMVWGHLLMGYSLTFLSLIGFVALSGVVVNDAIVFMEFYNVKRAEGGGGVSALDAAYVTGKARLRAILLTTITTTAGLAPLMLEQSFQARVLIPMAITICFGLVASTGLVLVALPCLLVALERVKRVVRMGWKGQWEEPLAASVRG
jgi:multidrug efflux pump subunit AcrB